MSRGHLLVSKYEPHIVYGPSFISFGVIKTKANTRQKQSWSSTEGLQDSWRTAESTPEARKSRFFSSIGVVSISEGMLQQQMHLPVRVKGIRRKAEISFYVLLSGLLPEDAAHIWGWVLQIKITWSESCLQEWSEADLLADPVKNSQSTLKNRENKCVHVCHSPAFSVLIWGMVLLSFRVDLPAQ